MLSNKAKILLDFKEKLRLFFQSDDPKKVRIKQWLLLSAISFSLIFILVIAFGSTSEKESIENKKSEEVKFSTPNEDPDITGMVISRLQEALDKEHKSNLEILDRIERLDGNYQSEQEDKNQMRFMLNDLDTKFQTLESKASKYASVNARNNNDFQAQTTSALSTDPLPSKLEIYALTLSPSKQMNKSIENYVPTGTFIKATLLSGLEAATSVSGQANPRPVLLRLMTDGILPNKNFSKLKSCFITGAGVGDISSERAYIRLESLSCVKENNEILETSIYGTVVGPDGRDGVRGKVVWRDRPLLKNSFIAGGLSGLGNGIAQQDYKTSISPLGATQTFDPSSLTLNAAATGASTAMEKLADYYLKRADLYHPVIEISAGTQVDIVILKEGFYLDDLQISHKQTKD